jgi:polygalacturonase
MCSTYILLSICILYFFQAGTCLYIEDFGAKPDLEVQSIAVQNTNAFLQALTAANASDTDKTVVFPEGKVYYMFALNITNFHNVVIQIDGTLKYSNDIESYPAAKNYGLMYFLDCEGIHFQGKGMIDGQGLNWWRKAYLGNDFRPDMISFHQSRDLTLENLYLYSSPKYSINFVDCADVIIHDMTIFVNSSMVRGKDKHSSVTYALNTDGIDLGAYNAHIYNNKITNYDDAIVAKPCRSNWKYCQCAGNILAENNEITYSTGLTIGSVPPNPDVNCVRNVTFRDTIMHRPLKAIYIKPNPGTNGIGIIDTITYENITIDHALWWTIWIGPQQQNQPGEAAGTGCNFLFPFIPVCPTQPLVTMTNIVLRNVHATETMPLFEGLGVILCDPANPCTNFVFDNVTNSVFTGTMEDIYEELPMYYIPGVIFPLPRRDDDWEFEYITSYVTGTVTGGTNPVPCFEESCFWVAPATSAAVAK